MSHGIAVRVMYALLYFFVGAHGNYFALWLRDVGWSGDAIGWQGGLYFGCLIVFPLAWGNLADRRGAVTALRVITVGSVLAFVPFLLTAAVAPLLCATVVFAAFRTGIVTTADTLTLHHVARRNGDDYGRYRIFGSMGFIAGGLCMGWLVDATSWSVVPAALLVVLLITALHAATIAPHQATPRSGAPFMTTVRRLLARRRLRRFYLVTFVSRVTSMGLYVFMPLHLKDLGVSDALLPAYWSIGVVSEIVLMRNAPRLFGARSPAAVLTLCFIISAVHFGAIALIREPLWLLPVMLLHGMSFGIWYYSSVVWLSSVVPPQDRARAQGVFQSVGFGLGGTLSAIGAGYLYDAGKGPALFAVGAALALVTAGLSWRLLMDRTPA